MADIHRKLINCSKKFLGIMAFIIILAAVCLILFLIPPKEQRADYRRIASETYDTVFLAMFPTDTYHEEDFTYYRAMTVFKSSYCIPDLTVLKKYLNHIERSGNTVTTAYLGIRPDKINIPKLQELVGAHPDILFEIIISTPSAAYWQQLSENEYEKVLNAYCDLMAASPNITGANFYFMGHEEWLIANPDNYENQWLTSELISRTLMTYCDIQHEYLVNPVTAKSFSEALTTLTQELRSNPKSYPDLSDHCIILFGDSVFAGNNSSSALPLVVTGSPQNPHGNYTDTTSISGVLSALTDATVYNCGYGGNSAAMEPKTLISLPGIVEAFFAHDLTPLPTDAQVYVGVSSYLEDTPEDKQMCYVINYGLNDFFHSLPISSDDPYDITTYNGAIRTAVTTIRANDPDAQIILCTPTFTGLGQEEGTQPAPPVGSKLEDYVDAVLLLGADLHVDVLDNYHTLGITLENMNQYLLSDQVHPNSACRYLIAENIIRLIQ